MLADHAKTSRTLSALTQNLLKCQVQMLKSNDSKELVKTVKGLQKEGNAEKTQFSTQVVWFSSMLLFSSSAVRKLPFSSFQVSNIRSGHNTKVWLSSMHCHRDCIDTPKVAIQKNEDMKQIKKT